MKPDLIMPKTLQHDSGPDWAVCFQDPNLVGELSDVARTTNPGGWLIFPKCVQQCHLSNQQTEPRHAGSCSYIQLPMYAHSAAMRRDASLVGSSACARADIFLDRDVWQILLYFESNAEKTCSLHRFIAGPQLKHADTWVTCKMLTSNRKQHWSCWTCRKLD